MKNLRTSVLCACFALISLVTHAQGNDIPVNEPDYNKPRLFTNLPDQVTLNTDDLANLFGKNVGSATSLKLNNLSTAQFEGQVVSSGTKYENTMQSMVIRSTNFSGANLTLTRITNPDGSHTYRGRIISLQHGDLYELQQQNGVYSLVKRNFYDLINE